MNRGSRPLRVLLVGYDGAGIQNHQLDMYEPAFQQHPDFRIVAIADDSSVSTSRREISRGASVRLGVPYHDDLEEAMGRHDIDVMSVCVSFDRRVATIEIAASHGKHVLVDKPMALNLDDVDAITSIVHRAGIVCMPAHHHRFKDSVRQAIRTVADGRIGNLLAVHADFLVARGATRATSDRPTVWPLGELMNFAVYPIDTIRAITARETRRVQATRGGFFFGGDDDEDFGVLTLDLDDGVPATVSVGRTSLTGYLSGGEHRYRLVGADGMLLVNAQESVAVLHGRQAARKLPAASATNSVTGLLDALASAIRSGGQPALGPDDARSPLAITLAARRSADTGTVVEV